MDRLKIYVLEKQLFVYVPIKIPTGKYIYVNKFLIVAVFAISIFTVGQRKDYFF